MQTVPSALGGFRGLRGELLIALKKAPHPLTAKELAEQFRVTANGLRRHLRALEDRLMVRRTVVPTSPPSTEYSLTAFGERFNPILDAIVEVGRDIKAAKRHEPTSADALSEGQDPVRRSTAVVHRAS